MQSATGARRPTAEQIAEESGKSIFEMMFEICFFTNGKESKCFCSFIPPEGFFDALVSCVMFVIQSMKVEF